MRERESDNAPTRADATDLKRELTATLAARHELGPEYDAHLADAFVEKVTAQLSARLDTMQRQIKQTAPRGAPTYDQRLGLAIVSIVMLIPLVAIVLGAGLGLLGLTVLLTAIIAINIAFRYL